MPAIVNLTRPQLDARISRYGELREMTTRSVELAGIAQDAVDIIFARKIMPVILDDTRNPFGSAAPIVGAARTTMFISMLPPGQGPCLHSHNETYETFFVLEGSIEYRIGDPVEQRLRLDKWDTFSCPPNVYRGFHNVGDTTAVQLTVITGLADGRDDVSMPDSVAREVRDAHGEGVLDTFRTVFHFDPAVAGRAPNHPADKIHTPTQEALAQRVARFGKLAEMTTRTSDLATVPQAAIDLIFARKIMPVILDNTKNPFGSSAPIIGAAHTTMFISVMPPGQGACLHSHNDTYETFMVLDGQIEYHVGDPAAHTVTLNKWDAFSCPPGVYRGFRNCGTTDAVQLTVITGLADGRDDASVPDSVKRQLRGEFGEEVVQAFAKLFSFDPPVAA